MIQIAVLFIIVSIIFFILFFLKKRKEKYDYEKEYESAIIHGKNIAGTVFASYPENAPGLGWIL